MASKLKRTLKLGSWNANRGFLTKGKIFEIENQMMENKLDVCAVSEVDVINTKFHYDNLYEIKGYSFVFPTSWKKGKARMIVYYKKHLEPFIKIRRDLMSKNQPDVWLELKSKNDRNLVVGFYYREFTGMDGDRSIEQQRVRLKEWTSAASKVEDEKKELVAMGDFNVDLLKEHDTEDPDSISNILKACCLENGWEQKITLPTRSRVVEGRLESSCLDHIYCNDPTKIRKIRIIKIASSDHDLIKCERMMNDGLTPEAITVRTYKNFDKVDFNGDLSLKNWDEFYAEDDLNGCTEILTRFVKESMEKHAPKVRFTPKASTKKWISRDTLKVMTERDEAYAKCKSTKAADDMEHFKKLRNKVVGLLRKDKSKQFAEFQKPKDAWKLLKEIEKKADSNGPPKKLRIDGEVTADKKKIADHMNKFFIEKVEKNILEIDKTNAKYSPSDHFRSHMREPNELFEFTKVNLQEVEEAIDKLKPGRGAGRDEISNFIIKSGKDLIKNPLKRIINLAIEKGTFPKPWKDSLIIPLHKKDEKQEAKNYRPITILNKMSLCLETILLKQMTEHWKRLDLISSTQHGYMESRSCTTALATMYDDWTRNADQNKFVGILLLDQSSAFELVDPFILTDKLDLMKTSEKSKELILSYLLERPQMTVIEDYISETIVKNLGVPAGSKIGPLLYSIYTTDLPKTTEGVLTSYADDCTNSVAHKSALIVKEKLEQDAEAICDYMRANRLLIAESKTEFILAASKQKVRSEDAENIKIKVGKHEIPQSPHAKILGLLVNKHLDWTTHLFGIEGDKNEEGLVRKLSKRIGLAYKVQHLPFKLRKMIITGTFLAKLTYGIEIWGSVTNGQRRQIELLQNRAARMITKNHRSVTAKENLKECGWLSVENLIKLKTLTLLQKEREKQSIPYFVKLVGRGRNEMSSKIPEYESEQGRIVKNATVGRFIKEWNNLPLNIRKTPSKEFKKVVKLFIETQELENDV